MHALPRPSPGLAAIALAAALPFGAAPALAQPADAPPLAAIGRVLVEPTAPDRGCTGVLVGPTTVVTARHCVTDGAGGIAAPGDVRFVAGLADGRPVAAGRVAAIFTTPATAGAGTLERLESDLARLTLSAPLAGVAPVDVTRSFAADQRFTIVGYPLPAPPSPAIQTCRLVRDLPPLLALDCTVGGGWSGAPVLLRRNGMWSVTAIVVARTGDPAARSIALRLPAALMGLAPARPDARP